MSTTLAEKRMLQNVTAYKQSLRNIEPAPLPEGSQTGGLPNDAARSSKSQRTRQRRYGNSRHTSEAMAKKTTSSK